MNGWLGLRAIMLGIEKDLVLVQVPRTPDRRRAIPAYIQRVTARFSSHAPNVFIQAARVALMAFTSALVSISNLPLAIAALSTEATNRCSASLASEDFDNSPPPFAGCALMILR
jgi:hypothetical protein